MAELPLELFVETLGQAGVPAVDYDPEELAGEVEVAR
jgi:predicted HTH domain antitoxin